MLDQVDGAVASFTADGAVPSNTAEFAPTQRDRHLRSVGEQDRLDWQAASSYNWRTLVEADISCFKRVIGDGRPRWRLAWVLVH